MFYSEGIPVDISTCIQEVSVSHLLDSYIIYRGDNDSVRDRDGTRQLSCHAASASEMSLLEGRFFTIAERKPAVLQQKNYISFVLAARRYQNKDWSM